MNNKKTVGILTLGCRVNMYESCSISERLREHGYEILKEGKCDYYIVNTCAVTAESERKSRQLVRRCARNGKVLVIGCASQLVSDFNDIDNVIYVGGNRNKMAVVDAIVKSTNSKINAVEDMAGAPYENMYLNNGDELFSKCRAFIKIQDGCNGKCTYCIIPKCRGSVRSRDADDVVEEAIKLVSNGYKEIILTGIEVSAYNKMPLADLILELSKIDGLERLRLGSLSPNVINAKFLESVSKSNIFMPHIHLSLQSCSDKILQLMKRPYRKKDIFERVDLIRKYLPNVMLSADIIVGFPNESEEDFLETMNALRELGIYHVHSFPYSERRGTEAATMPNSVPKAVRASRNTRLIESCAETRKSIFESLIGQNYKVLVEKIVQEKAFGHTENFIEAGFECKECSVGDIIEIVITSYDNDLIYGDVIK
ncbi:MAG: tRNA (N(6)-L-threonylcarbamoyladenosine(37)-C(2))-methylthiotransferase MtaB [Clostridia bacterium]|nr:tRNA (N(6)-L-threonylcarbamoyladenosine(37)-C(2))-methylthiotransferase MtaB [Clostridia bacterium]